MFKRQAEDGQGDGNRGLRSEGDHVPAKQGRRDNEARDGPVLEAYPVGPQREPDAEHGADLRVRGAHEDIGIKSAEPRAPHPPGCGCYACQPVKMDEHLDKIDAQVSALLDRRLAGLAKGLKEAGARLDRQRDAIKGAIKRQAEQDDLLKRHEAICKTAYWAVARLREQGTLPDSKTSAQSRVDAAGAAAGAYSAGQEDL
jgi:hypothetical protein